MNTQKYDFNFSAKCAELHEEAQEMIESGDLCSDTIMDWIADIETAKKNFVKSLPWWYKMRWSDLYMTDPETYKEALSEYERNMYKKF